MGEENTPPTATATATVVLSDIMMYYPYDMWQDMIRVVGMFSPMYVGEWGTIYRRCFCFRFPFLPPYILLAVCCLYPIS